ncbi:MAG: VWA domain-containing protein [Campylobacterota bacterium]|nr:VWA domain-containing protein [Campylobacterota bacterium]
MSFLALGWLWLLLPLGSVILYIHNREGFRWTLQRFWLVAAMGFVILALCRPVLPKEPIEVDQVGSDVIVAIDLSYSMQATDVDPSRLEAAKSLLQDLVKHNTKDRFGVIGFTTNAIVLSPMTNDGELLLHLFGGLDEKMIMTKGTLLMGALELSRKMSAAKHPKVLLLTDGGDAQNYAQEAAYAKANSLQVNVVLLGTAYGSTLKHGDGTMLKDEKGGIVVTSLNRAVETIARASGGEVIDGADLGEVQDTLAKQGEEDFRSKTKVIAYDELFYYFIVAALIAFMLAVTTLGKMLQRRIAPFLLLFGISSQAGMLDYYYLDQGDKAYRSETYEQAARFYGNVASSKAQYNAANSLYKAGEYEKALQLYRGIRSWDADFKATLFFNMANCYIRLQEFKKAKKMLRNSLILKDDPAARENLYAISRAEEQDFMLSGRQEGKKREQSGSSQSESKAKKDLKEGGGSNMRVTADASQGASKQGKSVETDPRLGFSKGDAKLSSRQYELINQRSVDEVQPW